MTGITRIDPVDFKNFRIVTPSPDTADASSDPTSVDLVLNNSDELSTGEPALSEEEAESEQQTDAGLEVPSMPLLEWVPAAVCPINPDNKSYYISCWRPGPSYRGFGDTDVRNGLVPAVRVWRLEEGISTGIVAQSIGWERVWNNEHCAVYLPTPPPGFVALGLVTVKMNPKERWKVPVPEAPVLCLSVLSEQLQEVSPFTINKGVWHSRKTDNTLLQLHRLKHGLVWPEPSPFSDIAVPQPHVLNRVPMPGTAEMIDRVLALTPGQVAMREEDKPPPDVPFGLAGSSSTQLEGVQDAVKAERRALENVDDIEQLISFGMQQVRGAQLIIDLTTERAEAAAAAIGNERFSTTLEAKTALTPDMLAAAGVTIPVDAHLCAVIQDALERRVAPYAVAAKEDTSADMRFSATPGELQAFVDSVLATSIVFQVRSEKYWRTTRVLRHADLKAADLPDDLPPTLLDVVQIAIATTEEPPQTLKELRELGFLSLRVSCIYSFPCIESLVSS